MSQQTVNQDVVFAQIGRLAVQLEVAVQQINNLAQENAELREQIIDLTTPEEDPELPTENPQGHPGEPTLEEISAVMDEAIAARAGAPEDGGSLGEEEAPS